MKKIVLLVAILFIAAPAMAAVDIVLSTSDTSAPYTVSVSYDASGETELPRAFALNISCSAGAGQITAITNYIWGESTNASPGFGVFMGAIDYANLVTDPTNPAVWGNPRATDAGAVSTAALPQAAITVEMGSLYDSAVPADAPLQGSSGSPELLFKIVVDGDCTVTVTANTSRGADTGVRNESGDEATMTSTPLLLEEPTGWVFPECWGWVNPSPTLPADTYATQCHGDSNGDDTVDTADWPLFRDGFGRSHPNATYLAKACGDYNRDGTIDTADWPQFRDNFGQSPAHDCAQGDNNNVYGGP